MRFKKPECLVELGFELRASLEPLHQPSFCVTGVFEIGSLELFV
jgi:hypothetical protein